MAKTDLSVKIGAEYVGKAAFAKAEKSVKRLGKQVATLALGGSLLNFGRNSVKAFIESEKSAKSLYGTLGNLNLAYRKDDVNKYIDKLSLATGIVDETLNPAFQQFLLTTRDVAKSQQLLSTALDISAGTGYDLGTVTKSLSAAYAGNKTSLAKMQLGLSRAQIEANDFRTILRALNSIFAGQAVEAASGYTGQIDKLNVAIEQLKENAGKGLVEALSDGKGNIDQTAENIAGLGTALGTATGYLAKFAVGWAELFSKDAWTQFWDDLTGKKPLQIDRGVAVRSADRADQKRLDAQARKTALQQLNATKALTEAQKKAAALKKAQGVLDIEQAGILAALQGKITDNEKLRLQLQLALVTENVKEADRLSNLLVLSQARTTGLATYILNLPSALNPFANYPTYVLQALAEIAKLADGIKNLPKPAIPVTSPAAGYSPTAGNLMNPFVGDYAKNYGAYAESPFTPYSGNPNPTVYNYNISGATQGLLDELQNGLLNNSASGQRSTINRTNFVAQ
jgi:hypothetical protein